MGRTYAGILGPLALLACLAHGVWHGRSADTILLEAWVALVGFAALGGVLGWIAGRTVEEAVRSRVALPQEAPPPPTPPAAR